MDLTDHEVARLADAIARELRSGSDVVGALRGAATSGPVEVSECLSAELSALDRGEAWAEVGAAWARRSMSDGVALLVTTMTLASEVGGGAAAVDACAAAIRSRSELRDEIRSLTAQVRASAALVTALPVVGVVGLGVLDHRVLAFYGSASGLTVGAAGVLLEAVGWWWMRRLVGAVA